MLNKIITVTCLACAAAFGQDWRALFEGLVSTDSAVSEAARQQAFSLLQELVTKSDEAVNAEIIRLLPVAEDPREEV